MSKIVVLITSQVAQGHAVGEAWQAAGAPGVTFIESYGLYRLQEHGKSSEVLPGVLSMLKILRDADAASLIVLSVVADSAAADQLIAVTEALLGDLQQPHSGLLFVLDAERVIGLRDHRA